MLYHTQVLPKVISLARAHCYLHIRECTLPLHVIQWVAKSVSLIIVAEASICHPSMLSWKWQNTVFMYIFDQHHFRVIKFTLCNIHYIINYVIFRRGLVSPLRVASW